MLDFGFGELLLLGVIALVVLGPERLPVAARLLGRWLRTARNQWNAVKAELENEIADEELRRQLREAADALRTGVQPLADATGPMLRRLQEDPATIMAGTLQRDGLPDAAATGADPAPAVTALADANAVSASPGGPDGGRERDPAQGLLFDADGSVDRQAAAERSRRG